MVKSSSGISFFLSILILFGNRYATGLVSRLRAHASSTARAAGVPDGWTLIPVQQKVVQSLKDLVEGVYMIEFASVRRGCDRGVERTEYLGFNNRTCSTALTTSLTSGPVMRSRGKTQMWREWMVRVHNTATENTKIVSLQAFINPENEDDAFCLGFVSTFYENAKYTGTCVAPPYGDGLFLNATWDISSQKNPQSWTVRPSKDGDGLFDLIASSKPVTCARLLTAQNCTSRAVLVEESSSVGYPLETAWRFIRVYDIVPPSPPPPPPPAPPSPPLVLGLAGPVISAPSSTTSGIVNVVVEQFSQDTRCSASSVVIEYSANTIGSRPQTVEEPVKASLSSSGVEIALGGSGYYSIYAYSKCTNGQVTERSNGLTVFSQVMEIPRDCRARLHPGTDWAIGCAQESCKEVCSLFSKFCNAASMQSVLTEEQGAFVASLFSIYPTYLIGEIADPDAPVIDIEENGEIAMFYNGTYSDCSVTGLFPQIGQVTPYPQSRRFCCCGKICPTQ